MAETAALEPVAAAIAVFTAKAHDFDFKENVKAHADAVATLQPGKLAAQFCETARNEYQVASDAMFQELEYLMGSFARAALIQAANTSVDVFETDQIEEIIQEVLKKSCKLGGLPLPKTLGNVDGFVVSAAWRVEEAVKGPIEGIPELLKDLVIPGHESDTPEGWPVPVARSFAFQRQFHQATLLPLGDGGNDAKPYLKTCSGTATAVLEAYIAHQEVDLNDDLNMVKFTVRPPKMTMRLAETPNFKTVVVAPEPIPEPIDVKIDIAEPGWVALDAADLFEEISLAPELEIKPEVKPTSPTSTSAFAKLLTYLGKASGKFASVVSRRAKPAAPGSSSKRCVSSSSPSSYESSIDYTIDLARTSSSPSSASALASSTSSLTSTSSLAQCFGTLDCHTGNASASAWWVDSKAFRPSVSRVSLTSVPRESAFAAVPSATAVWW